MSAQLIDHNEDLKKLVESGLVLEIKNNFLLIHRIPYLNSISEIKYGTLVSKLQLSGNKTRKNPEHTVYWSGEMPCRLDGTKFNSILNNSNTQQIADSFEVNFRFSSKPKPNGYSDYHHKMTTYIKMITAPAKAKDKSVTEKGKAQITQSKDEYVFNYLNTNSSKPELSTLEDELKEQKIAIIGLGGTGSYILDLVAKVPVKEIHIYDGDWFYNNNAFRAPGAPSIDDLTVPKKKVVYLQNIYSKMHKGIKAHPLYLKSENVTTLDKFDFVFLSLDSADIKKDIIKFLEKEGIPFIDVGIGVNNNQGALTGLVRTTTGTPSKTDHIWDKNYIPFTKDPDNDYDSNIQIAELNSLNATLAVIKWKKLFGFYHDRNNEHTSFYRINSNKMLNEETES